jgi:hypothetical protein
VLPVNVGLWPYPLNLDSVVKFVRYKNSSLFDENVKKKVFVTLTAKYIKLFFFVTGYLTLTKFFNLAYYVRLRPGPTQGWYLSYLHPQDRLLAFLTQIRQA